MIEIVGVKTISGYYLNIPKSNYDDTILGLLINGEHPEKTFQRSWVFSIDEPKRVERKVRQRRDGCR